MNPLRHCLLAARTTLVTPMRRARMRSLAAESKAPLSVIFYHRVADSHPNDWTIDCDRFRRHLDFCQRNFELIDLAEIQRRVREGESPGPAVSITFDDGYRDNCDFALPLLVERQIPCTYFVATANILEQSVFPHDELAGVPLGVNTATDVRKAADAGIEIGCHTRTHVDFSRIDDPAIVHREIVQAKRELEQMIGKTVRYFAFPYGLAQHLTPIAIEAVIEAGFEGFCSAFGGYNLVGKDAFHIRRFHGDPEMARLKNWLSFDPRKLRREPKVSYRLPPDSSQSRGLAPVVTSDVGFAQDAIPSGEAT